MKVKSNQNSIGDSLGTIELQKKQELNKSQTLDKNTNSQAAKASSNLRRDYSVDISNSSRDLQVAKKKAFEIAKNTPDINQAKVDELKAKIKNGEYVIDNGKIADGILREAVREKLSTLE